MAKSSFKPVSTRHPITIDGRKYIIDGRSVNGRMEFTTTIVSKRGMRSIKQGKLTLKQMVDHLEKMEVKADMVDLKAKEITRMSKRQLIAHDHFKYARFVPQPKKSDSYYNLYWHDENSTKVVFVGRCSEVEWNHHAKELGKSNNVLMPADA